MGDFDDLLAKAIQKYGVQGAGKPGNVYTDPMKAKMREPTAEGTAAEAAAGGGKYAPGELDQINQVQPENDDPSVVDTTIVATPAAPTGPRGALQVEDRLAERMAPGAMGNMHQGQSIQAASAMSEGEAVSREEKQVADWYKRNREEQSGMLSKSMADYQRRRDAIDEFTPKLMEAADRIQNMRGGSFWSDMKDGIAYQSMVAMHLVSDDHLGVAKATQDLVNNQLNKERFKLDQAKSSYDAMNSVLGQYRALAGDAQLGDQLYRRSALDVAAMQIEEMAHGLKSETAKNNAMAIVGKIQEDRGKIDMQIGQQTFRQGSIQDARLADYNNKKAAQQEAAQLGEVGAQLLRLGGGDPEKAATIAVRAGMPAERVTAALAAATGAPASAGAAKVPGRKGGAVAATAPKGKPDKGETDPYGSYGAALASPKFWKETKSNPDRVYTAARGDLLSQGDTGTVARMAYAKAKAKLESEGNGKQYGELVGAISKGLSEADTHPTVSKIRQAYTTARALRSEYDTLNSMFEKASKTTGIPKEDISAAYMKGGRTGLVESLIAGAGPAKVNTNDLTTRLREAGLLNERAIAPRVLVGMANRVSLANATDTFGTLRTDDMKYMADIGSQLNPTWTELGTQLRTTDTEVRQKAVSGTVGIVQKELKGAVMQNAMTRQQIADIMEDKMRGNTGNAKAGVQRAMVK